MKRRLIYVELKSGRGDRGPAWIGYGEFSKSGRTIYFNDQAFQSSKGTGVGANYHDLESGEGYWISGIKREGGDRHWSGGGIIWVDQEALADYLALRDVAELDPRYYRLVVLKRGDVRKRVQTIENEEAV